MYRYMKPTLMLATPILVYIAIYTVGVVTANEVFSYLAVYMAACCAMLMLFVVARHTDDYKSALAAVAFGASVYFASSYFIQLLSQQPDQRTSYAIPVSVTPAATVIQRWLVGKGENRPQQMPQQISADNADNAEPAAPKKAEDSND